LKFNLIIAYFTEYELTQKLLTTIPRLSTEWFISFDLTLHVIYTTYLNLIHLSGGDGDRIHSLFQRPKSSKLGISTFINGASIVYSFDLDLNVTHHIEIDQTYYDNSVYRFNVNINGEQLLSQSNSDVKQFYNVEVWTSKKNPPPDTNKPVISNLTFVNFSISYLYTFNI